MTETSPTLPPAGDPGRTLRHVRRTIEGLLEQFVFAPNDATTWRAVEATVTAYLRGLWSQGLLIGARPGQAFQVEVGLGSTMTDQDVVDGYLIVQVTLQVTRPAEFIELLFRQRMNG